MKADVSMRCNSLAQQKFFSLLLVSSANIMLEVLALLTDIIIAGHAVGEIGISAMNVISPIISIMAFAGNTIAGGILLCYNSAMGRFDKKRADELFGMSVIVSVALGVIIFIAGEMWFSDYLSFMSIDTEIAANAAEYYSFIRFYNLIEPFNLLLFMVVYNDGDTFISGIANFTKIFGNIIASLVCVFVLNMGMDGIAIGTLVSDVICIALLSLHFVRKSNSLHPRIHFSFRDLWDFCLFGFADSEMYLMWSILMLALNKFIIVTFGDVYLPVSSVIIIIVNLSIVFNGIAQAVMPMVSVYYSEGNYPAIRKIMKTAINLSLIEGAVLSVIIFVYADYVPALFDIDGPAIVGYCANAARIVSSTLIFSSLLYLFETYYMVQEKHYLVALVSFTRTLAGVLVCSCLLSLVIGIDGIAAGFAVPQPLVFVIGAVIMRAVYGRENFPLYLESRNNLADYDLLLTPENVMNTRDEAASFMAVRKVSPQVINHVMLLIEETGMMIIERNSKKRVLAEYTLEIKDEEQARLTIRDNGDIFNITDLDINITSLRSYFLAGIMSIDKERVNITSTSFNRNVLNVLIVNGGKA